MKLKLKKIKKIKLKQDHFFLFSFLLIVLFSFSLIVYRLYSLQIVQALENNHLLKGEIKKIPPLRGNIYFRDKDGNLFLVATSFYLYDLYFYPPKSKNIEEELNKINEKIKIENIEKVIEEAKNSNKSLILKKNLKDNQKKEIEKLNFDSIFFEEKVVRSYPLENTFSTILGFVRFNPDKGVLEGQYGLEKYYDEILKGEPGYRKDYQILKNPQKGADLVLNIDYYLQRKTEEILKEAIDHFKAEGGLIIVTEVKTGNILAVAEWPNYHPHKFNEVKDYQIFVSRLSKTYEPGSVMKPYFYAGAFNENLVTPSSTYEDKGYVILDGWKIENFDQKGRGIVDLKTALEQSLNTGAVYLSQVLGKNRFLKYVETFRLNQKPEVDFPLLESPNFSNLINPGRAVNFGTASFGQGVSVSPLNLVQSYLAFANKGKIYKLNFAHKFIYADGSKKEIKPQLLSQILKPETYEKILPILEGVVENQAKKAKIKGYTIAGKTGSSLIPSVKLNPEDPSGYTDEVITTFIGFFPVSDPQYLILVRLDKPEKRLLAFGTAAPTFRKVAEFLINYFNIEPDKFEELF